MKKVYNYEDLTKHLNEVKSFYKNIPVTKERLQASLTLFPKGNTFWQVFKNQFLEREGKKTYRFKSEQPIYIKAVETCFSEYFKLVRKYNQPKEKTSLSIESAIKLLKENGYKVYKQTIQYEEV